MKLFSSLFVPLQEVVRPNDTSSLETFSIRVTMATIIVSFETRLVVWRRGLDHDRCSLPGGRGGGGGHHNNHEHSSQYPSRLTTSFHYSGDPISDHTLLQVL